MSIQAGQSLMHQFLQEGMEANMPRGRPPKLRKEDKFQAYIYHIAGLPTWEIAKEFNCSDRTIHKALDWVREQIPRYDETQNLLDIIHATWRLIRDLNNRRQQILGDNGEESLETESIVGRGQKTATTNKKVNRNWNAYIGIMRELRENHLLLHKLQGIQKVTMEVGDDLAVSLWKLMNGKRGDT